MAEEDNTSWYDKVSGFMGLGDDKTVDPATGLTPQQRNLIGYNQLGQLGALLMAAGQKQMPSERARYLAQIGNIPAQMQQQQQAAVQQRLSNVQLNQAQQKLANMQAIQADMKDPAAFKAKYGFESTGLTPEQVVEIQSRKLTDTVLNPEKREKTRIETEILRQQLQGNEDFAARLRAATGGNASVGTVGGATPPVSPPGVSQAAGAPAAGGFGNLTPEDLQTINSLPLNVRQQAAKELMLKRSTETRTAEVPLTAEERKQMDIPEGQPAFKKMTYYPSGKSEVTGYHVPTINRPENKLEAGFMTLSVENFKESKADASAARDSLTTSNTLIDLLDEGIFSGAFAPQKLKAAKYAKFASDFLGVKPGPELDKLISSTETYNAAVKDKVMSIVKILGANPSNSDREFALDVAAGNIALDENTMRRILAKDAELNKSRIDRYNQLAKDYSEADLTDSMKKLLSPLLRPIEAPVYNPKKREEAPAATANPAARSLAPQDQSALDWANKNPNDPRAAQIKQRLGVQ
jgi:hypothetical protein